MNKQEPIFGRVGVLLGGSSRERPISIRSGEAVFRALTSAGVDVCKIDPATKGALISELKRLRVGLAFIALHGRGGEDGSVQKILDRSGIPYVGSGAKASLSAFDKFNAKTIFTRSGIPTPEFAVLTRRDWRQTIRDWAPPYVVKPVDEGSSIGVGFVECPGETARVIVPRLKRYGRLLVERKIEGREFTVGILGDRALAVIELKPKRAFYDFRAKYTKGLTDYLVPAPLSNVLNERLKILALQAHRALNLRDLSRVDFKVDQEGRPFVLEANSIPGFTETSLLPKAAQVEGIDFVSLCLTLLEFAAGRKMKSGPGARRFNGNRSLDQEVGSQRLSVCA